MPQATTSAALTRLKPLENTNTGVIVEEHIRYWQKRKDIKEAVALARDARNSEFQRKIAKQDFDTYKGLSDIEAEGYFANVIIKDFDANAERLADLGQKANNGDRDAMIEFEQEKRKYKNYVNASKAVTAKSKELIEQKSSGTFNEHLDQDLMDFNEQFARSNYVLDPKSGKIKVYDKNNPKTLLEIDPQRLTNEYLNATFHKPVDFTATGTLLSKNLLDSVDGSKILDSNTKIKGNQLALNEFEQDPVLAKSWYKSQQKLGEISKEKTYEQLDDVEFGNLASSFYEKAIKPNISQTIKDTELEDSLKEQRLENARLDATKKRQAIKKGEKNAQKGINTVSIATVESGEKAKDILVAYPTTAISKDDTIYTIKGDGVTIEEVSGDKETRTTYSNFVRGENGIIAIGREVIKTPIFNDDGEPTGKSEEEVTDVVVTDKIELNKIATNITSKEGEAFNDLGELEAELQGLEGTPTPKSESKKTIKEGQVSDAAKKAGYTEEEYRKLLQEIGVQIIK